MINLTEKKFFFLLFIFVLCKNILAQSPYIQHFTILDGLPSNNVYKVYQDSKKFIWFATDAGLARFDGSKFTYFRKNNGMSCNEVFDIKEDSQGRIWFFNLNATLNYFYQNNIYNEKNSPFLDSLRSNDIFRNFFEDETKTLYFYRNKGREIYSLDSLHRITRIKLPSILLPNDLISGTYEAMDIRYICKVPNGEFLLFSPAGIYKTGNLKEKPQLVNDAYKIRDVILSSNRSTFLIVREKFDDQFVIKEYNGDIVPVKFNDGIEPVSKYVSSMLKDDKNILWLSTYDKGVFCYNQNKIIRHIDIKDAKAILQDHEGNIWISSQKEGVYKISPYINEHIQYESKLFEKEGILYLAQELDGGIWCTNGKKVYLLKNNELLPLNFQANTSSLNQMLQINRHTLIVGESSTPPYAIEGLSVDPAGHRVNFERVAVSPVPMKRIILNKKGDLLTSFDQFKLFFLKPNHPFEQIVDVDLGERINYLFYNASDNLNINARKNYSYNETGVIKNNELARFENKLIVDQICLNETSDLINVEGDSLFILKQGKIFNLSSAIGFPPDLLIKNMDYQGSTLCITTNTNVFICENPLDVTENKTALLKPIDINFKNIHDIRFNKGTLYVASDDGLTCIPITDIHRIKAASPVPYLRTILIDGQQLPPEYPLDLKGSKRINISFNCINYSISPIIFSYKLEGADTIWTTTKGSNVVLQNLPTGNYLFKLRARKPTSPWSEPIELSIHVKETVWQHPAFQIFVALLAVGLVFLVILRRKNAEIKKRQIEHQLLLLEQKSLQSMMNPHFIFNALGSIQNYLLRNKSNEAGVYLSQFARLIRQNLNAVNSATISLEEEVDRLKNYLDLEKLRMENKFDYQIEIDDSIEFEDSRIPSMIVQPFVENSVWHGIANLNQKGWISVRFKPHSEKSLLITIEDTGIGISNSAKNEALNSQNLKIGMTITRKRLKLLGSKYGVHTCILYSELTPGSPNPGTRAAVVVPFFHSDPDNIHGQQGN